MQIEKYGVSEILLLSWNRVRVWSLLFCLLIMPINLSIEALKWRYINKSNGEPISFSRALAAVIFGACAGFISPGRWAEPVARAYYFGKEKRTERIYWNLTGIIAQWLVIILAGILSLSIYKIQGTKDTNLYLYSLVFLLLLLVFYFSHDRISQWISTFSFVQNFVKIDISNLRVSTNNKVVIFGFTGLRFCVYSFQYLVLLKAFSSESSRLEILMKVFLLFFFQSFSIFPGLLDVGLKGNIALLVFKNSLITPLDLLFVIFYIWFINLLVPSFIGYILFYRKLRDFMKTRTIVS